MPRKRQAAAQLIQNYYKQLTEGCGDASCDNPACASSKSFNFKQADRNKLAIQAITLSREKAKLCYGIPNKFAKYPVQESKPSAAKEGASNSGDSPIAGGSGTTCDRGAKAKQPAGDTGVTASSSNSCLGSTPGNIFI